MRRVRHISIRWIVTGVILFTTVTALGIGVLLIGRHDVKALRDDLAQVALQTARTVGEYSVADLAFGTRADSAESLGRLRQDPSVEAAATYDARGSLFSSFARESGGTRMPVPGALGRPVPDTERREVPGAIEVFQPLVQDGARYGTLYLRTSTASLDRRIRHYVLTLLAIGGGMALLTLLFALLIQRVVSQPILKLARLAEQVSATEDWTLRAEGSGAREMWALTGGFNRVLAAIEQRQRQRDEAEAAQRGYADRLSVLRSVDRAILGARPPAEIAALALRGLERVAAVPCARAVEFEADLRAATVLASVPGPGPDGGTVPLAEEDGPWMQDLARGEPLVLAPDGPVPSFVAPLAERGLRSIVGFPLVAEGGLLGCLVLCGPRHEALEDVEVETVQEIAALLALAIHQARMAREIERHTLELEARVRERTTELSASNRELEAFGYSVAHDLRAPLRSVNTFSTAVLEDYGDRLDDTGRDLLRRVVNASQRMDQLIRDLLEYSRLSAQSIELGPVDLDAVVADVLAQASPFVQERGAQVLVEGPLGRARGHAAILQQAVANLLSNALKFVPPDRVPEVRIRCQRRDGMLRLCVEDNGIGVAPEHHDRIFRLFERLHAVGTYPGTGIGLAIVKRGAERLGGRAGVESEAGRGAVFWIEMPPERG